jgi:hypothetical protein
MIKRNESFYKIADLVYAVKEGCDRNPAVRDMVFTKKNNKGKIVRISEFFGVGSMVNHIRFAEFGWIKYVDATQKKNKKALIQWCGGEITEGNIEYFVSKIKTVVAEYNDASRKNIAKKANAAQGELAFDSVIEKEVKVVKAEIAELDVDSDESQVNDQATYADELKPNRADLERIFIQSIVDLKKAKANKLKAKANKLLVEAAIFEYEKAKV